MIQPGSTHGNQLAWLTLCILLSISPAIADKANRRLPSGEQKNDLRSAPRVMAQTAAPLIKRVSPLCPEANDLIQIEGLNFGKSGTYRLSLIGDAIWPLSGIILWSDKVIRLPLSTVKPALSPGDYRLVFQNQNGKMVATSSLRICAAVRRSLSTRAPQLNIAAKNSRLPPIASQTSVSNRLNAVSTDNGTSNNQRADPATTKQAARNREYLLLLPTDSLSRLSGVLTKIDARVVRHLPFQSLKGRVLAVIQVEAALSEIAVKRIVKQFAPDAVFAQRSRYVLNGEPRRYANAMVGINRKKSCTEKIAVRIGAVDGMADVRMFDRSAQHFVQKRFISHSVGTEEMVHGTAIASLLIGAGSGRSEGYYPAADLYMAAAFNYQNDIGSSTIDNILEAIDWLLLEDVRLINLSFSGPENAVFEYILKQTSNKGTIYIAAAGHHGPVHGGTEFPASSHSTIAVTAIDAASAVYPRSNQGTFIEFSAPGVDIWVPDSRGGRYVSGTSFAAPVVTALAAQQLAVNSRLSASALRRILREHVVDLGEKGHDPVFGWGLVQADPGCDF